VKIKRITQNNGLQGHSSWKIDWTFIWWQIALINWIYKLFKCFCLITWIPWNVLGVVYKNIIFLNSLILVNDLRVYFRIFEILRNISTISWNFIAYFGSTFQQVCSMIIYEFFNCKKYGIVIFLIYILKYIFFFKCI